jgi:hypothetical protein
MQQLKDRLTAWKSTLAGLGWAAALFTALQTLGCTPPDDWRAWAVSAIPAIIGALKKDKV